MHSILAGFLTDNREKVDAALRAVLVDNVTPETLQSSMMYSVEAGGKRIRPLLVLATLEDLGVISEDAVTVACAVELIHTYSLIHDDLPSMDDDDYRRGLKTNHIVYGEALAILAGDALQTLAFELLATLPNTKPTAALTLVRLLAEASGKNGMVAGQVLDIEGEAKKLTLQQLQTIHVNKTGALLSFCIEAGAVLANVTEEQRHALRTYAQHIGIAFQIQDDILDVTSTTEQLGKATGSDLLSDKSTYPSLLGLDGAKEQLVKHQQHAKEALRFLNNEQSLLALFADYIVERTH